jgi:hypothetical protein
MLHLYIPNPALRKCSKCGRVKPLNCYGKDSTKPYGRRLVCKVCRRPGELAAERRWRAKGTSDNPDT